MEVLDLPPGKYVVAVSGGVDSMVLLDILAKRNNLEIVVAHFNHGIRPDAYKDELLVKKTTVKYGLVLEIGYGNLGVSASEELARKKRYEFLTAVAQKNAATTVVTAHHQDDLIETAFLNILRGSGHRGLTAILFNPKVKRPLVHVSKKEILDYAKDRNITWREDSTNNDTKYLRNYIRKYVMPKLNNEMRQRMVKNIEKVAKKQTQKDALIATISQLISPAGKINRQSFAALPTDVSNELIMYWLRLENLGDFDRKTIDRLNVALRTSWPGTKHPVKNNYWLKVGQKSAQLAKR